MARWMKLAAMGAGGLAAAAIAGRQRWNRETERAVSRLEDTTADSTEVFSLKMLDGLPEPVARYFMFALTPGQPLIRGATIRQKGEFRMGGFEAGWKPMRTRQRFATHPPGFVWEASISLAPLLAVNVRDSYLGGTGTMQAKMAGMVSLVDQSGSPELASGALQRYLAEAVWFPTALLPGPNLTWEPMDATRARATLTDGAISVSLEFTFGAEGEITEVYTPGRYRDVKGVGVLTPWGGRFEEYIGVRGVMTPRHWEVAWFLPEGRLPYCRGRNREIAFTWDK